VSWWKERYQIVFLSAIPESIFLQKYLWGGFMVPGARQGEGGRQKETVALIALSSEEGAISASYKVADSASSAERLEIARKLVEISQVIWRA
jgi:hypothetical protein